MEVRLGEILVASGVLTLKQVRTVLEQQQQTGEPFGLLCERLFHIDPHAIEEAWAAQYATITRAVEPAREPSDPRALEAINRRQAWQFRILPIRFCGEELMMATTQRHLRRALRFATNVIGVPVYFVLCTPRALGDALCRHYPLAGMTPQSVDDDYMDRLLEARSTVNG